MLENVACFQVNGANGEIVVSVAGDIDALSAPDFAVVVQGVATTDSQLVIDLSRVTFMDSSGLSVLAGAVSARGPDNRIRVRGASTMIQHVLATTGLDTVVTLEPMVA
jgi:anti-sigma B factor antagonist